MKILGTVMINNNDFGISEERPGEINCDIEEKTMWWKMKAKNNFFQYQLLIGDSISCLIF